MSSQPKLRQLEVEDQGEITIVDFIEEKILADRTIKEIREDLFSLFEQHGRKKMLLNFSNVVYLSTAMFSGFLLLNKAMNAAGGKLVMCNINDDIYEVFEITKHNKLFTIVKDEQTALATIQSPPSP